MQHLRQCNLPGLLVQRDTAAVRPRQAAYELDVGFPLLLEMVERVLRVGTAIQVQLKLRVVGLEFRPLFTQEPVQSHSVTVALGVGEVCQHFGNRKPLRRRFPSRIRVCHSGHQAAQDLRGAFQNVEAR